MLSSIFHLLICYYFTQIVGSSVAKGCPLLEYFDLSAEVVENPLYTELIALAKLRRLRSVFIGICVEEHLRGITPEEGEHLRASLQAIIDQGLLEVRIYFAYNKIIVRLYLHAFTVTGRHLWKVYETNLFVSNIHKLIIQDFCCVLWDGDEEEYSRDFRFDEGFLIKILQKCKVFLTDFCVFTFFFTFLFRI